MPSSALLLAVTSLSLTPAPEEISSPVWKLSLAVTSSKLTAPELIERVTGGPIQVEPYIRYLRSKFGEIYDLS